jgi:2,4-dienoyl-CoA reductase-like NADH-dependent reductase (Old Yellow Enzyme family)/thioredoxin reductase
VENRPVAAGQCCNGEVKGENGDQMKGYTHVFSPLKIGRITARNRIEVSPAIPFLASQDYFVTRELIEWHRRMAKGGAGIVTIGETLIDYEDARRNGRLNTLCLADERSINGLSVLVEAIHRYGAIASIELNYEGLCMPAEMTVEQVKAIISQFGDAAVRCMQAGMQMIMMHGGHGHLLGKFFSPVTNRRTDSYGGDLLKRAKFALDVLDAIREKVGDRLSIEYRISANELVPGAPTVEDTIEFARMIQNKIDLLHVSAGNLYAPETCARMIQPAYVPRGINVDYAGRFKQELNIPVTTVGSLTIDMAEKIIVENKADMVAMIRSIIADPDCVRKARADHTDDIRPCVRCNKCLSVTRDYTRPTRCSVNPEAGREVEFFNQNIPERKKKVVVIGGGPAGMEAARTAARRGHEVVLFEKDSELGGALIMASALPFKEDMRKYLAWARRMTLNAPNTDIRLSTEATAEAIATERPDVLIIAVGSSPTIPSVPGIDRKNVLWAGDVDMGRIETGKTVLVVGAGLTGCETALHLAVIGKGVTIIDVLPMDQIAPDVHPLNLTTLLGMLGENGVDIRPETKLEAVTDNGALVSDKEGNEIEIPCHTVVFSIGVTPRSDLIRMFENLAPEVHVVGDCRRGQGNLAYATADGFNAAIEL